jgi:hypothetical protein
VPCSRQKGAEIAQGEKDVEKRGMLQSMKLSRKELIGTVLFYWCVGCLATSMYVSLVLDKELRGPAYVLIGCSFLWIPAMVPIVLLLRRRYGVALIWCWFISLVIGLLFPRLA